ALGVVRPQQVVGGAPAAGTPFRREQPSQQIQQHLVQVGDKQYNVVTISKNQDGSYEVAVNEMGIPNDPNDPTKGSKQLGKQIAPSVKIPPEMIPKDIQSNQWGNDPKIIPLAGNGQRVWNVESDGTLRATDTYTSYNPATKQSIVTQDRIVIVPPDKSYSIETTSTYDKTGKVASSTQEYKETPIGSIGSKRTITALPGMRVTEANGQLIKENIKSVTVENLDGKKTEIAPKAFRDASDKIGSDRDSLFFFSEIANRRIGNVQAVQIEEGKVVVGDKNNRVEWVRGETGGIIAAYEGANLVGYINPDPKVGTYFSLREGKAELKDGAPVLSDGAVAHIRQIVNRQVVSDMIEQQVKDTKISLETKDRAETGTMTVSITKGSETPTTFTIASSDIKGYLEARQIGGETYYIGTGENIDLPFGLGGGEIYKKDANGKLVRADNAESIAVRNILNKERESRGQPTFEQVSSQRFFANLERAYTEFQGLGYYATLFFDDDSLLKWRNNVDRLFATLYLGTEYWSSTICGEYLDGEDDGIAYAETPQGLSQVAAHIEATRTEPILTPTGQEFIYKITFNVRNGDYDKDPNAPEEMHVNVVLRGERTVAIFKQEQKVKRGSSFGRIGRNAIAQDSTAFYNEICLTFDQTPLKWKTSNGEICNTIVESSGAPSTVATTATSTTASSGGGAAEGDVNDF
ncbi:hypothetical protein HY487_00140, partial [Candidatus Woesearchaeota archaeon]|nr:hypothetical protein [Candidatus Woesearchaeota archaeon]